MRDGARSYHFYLPWWFSRMHVDAQFRSSNLTVRTESVVGSTPGARVTGSTTLPPECVTSVRVVFRTTTNGVLVAANTELPMHHRLRLFRLVFSVVQTTSSEYWLVENQNIKESQLISFCQAIKCKFLLEIKKLCMWDFTEELDGGYYATLQQYQSYLEWELKSLQTTRVSECHGSGHVRVHLTLLV